MDIKETKLRLYKNHNQLEVAHRLMINGFAFCKPSLENIRLFGFELNKKITKFDNLIDNNLIQIEN